jgi:A/G-specific adenine glycosylase
MPVPLASLILDWYNKNARHLPWRSRPDPYMVLVSEVMLQQTRVETVIPYFLRWIERFPTLLALASASQEEVLSVWEGLGYYSRARALHKAAKIIVTEHAGRVPSDLNSLRLLPGVGRYTAAAVASIAFGMDVAALDGNIRRVLARVFTVAEPARSPKGERILWELATAHLPSGNAGDYNQALMDLGAVICTPRRPNCPNCPLTEICQARVLGIQEQLPVAISRRKTPHYTVTAAVIKADSRVLIARRPQQGLLGGLWEFPGGKIQEGESLPECLKREIMEELGVEIQVGQLLGVYKHAYTHFRVTLHAFYSSVIAGVPHPIQAADVRWVPLADLPAFPMGKIDRLISQDLLSL